MRSEASESEVGTQQGGGRGRAGTGGRSWPWSRSAEARKSLACRAVLESLEERQLLATVPVPIVIDRDLMPSGGTLNNSGNVSNESDPSIAVDRSNPQHLAAVWTRFDTDFGGGNPPDILVEAAYSTDGGQNWQPLNLGGTLRDPNLTSSPIGYNRAVDPSVAFDADGNIYILSTQSSADGSSGALVLDKFSFAGGAVNQDFTNKVVYQWVPATDGATNAMLAVDDSPATFTDPETGLSQNNPHSGTVYVAWASVDEEPGFNPSNWNPNRILMVSSSDGGNTFGGWSVVSDRGNFGDQRYSRPRMVVSQGTIDGQIAPGQVTVVWDDFGTRDNANPPRSIILSDRTTAGVNVNVTNDGGTIANASDPGGGAPHNPGVTDFTFDVNITDPRFLSISDVDLSLALTHAATQELGIELIAPDGTIVTLLRNQTSAAGTQNQGIGVSGADLGVVNGVSVGTTFDNQAARGIVDFTNAPPARGANAPFAGHFQPDNGSLFAFNGLTAAQANGTWTLRITDYRSSSDPGNLRFAELKLRSGLDSGNDRSVTTGGAAPYAVLGSISDVFPVGTDAHPNGIGPGVTIAQDNTLGSFSPFQGRIYVSYVGRDNTVGNPADNTDIYLSYSDDGGLNWSFPTQVNDDQGTEDGFSEGDDILGRISLNGRPQFQPNVAVDQATGTLVLSWYDTRHDAARARVATYMTASIDGGATFSEQTFANEPVGLVDAITGEVLTSRPIPDNQSAGNEFTEGEFAYGDNQGLAVHGGRIYPIWSGNSNTGPNPNGNAQRRLDIYSAVATIAAGPRIIDSTMGAVGLTDQYGNIIDPINNTTTPDGTPIVSGFEVTFDRPVDPTTFRAEDVTVFFRDTTATNASGGPVPVIDVVPQSSRSGDPDFQYNPGNIYGFTRFRVIVAPRSAVGTYSYAVRPEINDRIRGPQLIEQIVAPVGSRQTFNAAAVPVTIPDLATITSDLTISGQPASDVVADLNVNLTIDHTYSGDLVLTLIAPNGARIELARDQGEFNDDAYAGTIFDDEATRSINGATPPFTGSYRPAEPLDQIDGLALNGTWRLEVADVVGGDFGTLQSWSLDIQPGQVTGTTVIGSPGNLMDQDADATVGEVAQTNVGVGDVYAAPRPTATGGGFQIDPSRFFPGPYDPDTLPLVISGPQLVSSRVPGTPETGDNLVLNRPVSAIDVTFGRDMAIDSFTGADVLRLYGPTGELIRPTPFPAPDVNRAIPDLPASGVPLPLVSTLEVPGDGTFRIADLNFRLNLTHADTSQLLIELEGPDGTRVTLLDGIAGTAFTDTLLDDESPLLITQGTPPYTGTFRPASPLAAFDGTELRGTWRLIVTDNATGSTGTLQGWTLEATPLPQVAPVFNATADPTDPSSSRALSLPIPNGSTITSDLLIPTNLGVFAIADLNVTLDITHSRPQDLTVELIASDGTVVPLFAALGGALSRDFRNTTLDDEATTAINQAPSRSFTGIYQPQAGALSTLDGKILEGTWQLRVTDAADPDGTAGTLNSWSLTATPQDPAAAAARSFRVSFPTQRISGTYAMSLGSDILSRNGDRIDSNTDAGVDLLRGLAVTAPTIQVIYDSTDVPRTIPDDGKVTSVLSVPDSFLIADLNIRVNITHGNDPDLTAVLIAPDGTRITLFDGVGDVPGNRADFVDTVLDDQADTPIQNSRAPFFGTFNPQMPLGVLNGTNAAGTWALEITDDTPGGNGAGAALTGWSLFFAKPVPNSGLGDPVADRTALAFRVFRMDPSDPLSGAVWTPSGPASISDQDPTAPGARQGYSGRVSAITVDPSDPSGNTVYVGAASGGIWKTTDFLTADPDGPTWVPLTDFGPTFGLNIGSIAVFARNNNPGQSILIAATGEADDRYDWGSTDNPDALGSTTQGVGFLRSMDGGATWELLDSTDNSLPFDDRDHLFAANGGTAGFEVAIDPTPTPSGGRIVYAAMSGPNGGLWRSLDTGTTWEKMSQDGTHGTSATDIVLDLASKSVSTGNVDILYVTFEDSAGSGIYISPNRGQTLNLISGQIGVPQLRDEDIDSNPAVTVGNLPDPNGADQRITLAKPAVVPDSDPNSAVKNILYQGWLYAAVVDTDNATNTFQGVWLTKDFGQSWTQLQLPTLPGTQGAGYGRPSNDTSLTDYFSPDSPNGPSPSPEYTLTLVVDPNDPQIVYLGGTSIRQTSGLIRIDATFVHDAHALISADHNAPDGGQRWVETGTIAPAVTRDQNVGLGRPARIVPGTFQLDPNEYINLIRNPDAPFLSSSAVLIDNILRFNNSGAGVHWKPFDELLKANPSNLFPSTNIHAGIALRDPLTGNTRLLFGSDQGIFSGVDLGNGTLDPGIGSQDSATYSRVGNLQIGQLYQGAAQPTTLAAQIAGAMLYGATQGNGYPSSDPDILSNGVNWWLGDNNGELSGSDVATDQQGEGTVYQYKFPAFATNVNTFTEFFQVDGVPRTFGLIQTGGTFDPQWPLVSPVYPGLIAMGRFGVNPLDGDQIVISSNAGRIFATTNQGRFWNVIGNPGDLDGNYASAVVYGAPDPQAPGGTGNLGNFIYAGTIGGNIFLTRTGGGSQANAWQDVSAGLDGSSVVQIVPSPDRGSHEAYAVTLEGVYYTPDSLTTQWTNITGNLFSILQTPFGNAEAAVEKLSFLTSIRADWRYAIPENFDDPDSTTHPVLYVAGDAGVYRLSDFGFFNGGTAARWDLFPAVADGAPKDGGYLPSVPVTDLDMALGRIDPTNGRPIVNDTSPNVLMASTFGRGSFSIRLAPQVLPTSLDFAVGSDSGASATDRVTNVSAPTIEGLSAQTAFGSSITINLIDLTDETNPVIVGTGTTDSTGRFSITVTEPLTDGIKTIGVQATDQAGTLGNVVLFEFTLDTQAPAQPGAPDLQADSDSGLSDTDNYTNATVPVFDVATGEPASTVLTLYRGNDPVNSRPVDDLSPVTAVADPGTTFPTPPDGPYVYKARLVDLAGNVSVDSDTLAITIDTTAPPQPNRPTLKAEDDTGDPGDNTTSVTRPRFTGISSAVGIIELLDVNDAVLGTAPVNGGNYEVRPDQAFPINGDYTLRVQAVDRAGNTSPPSPPLTVTIDSTIPDEPAPTIALVSIDDSGIKNDVPVIITNVVRPRFEGDAAAGATVELYLISSGVPDVLLATGIANGRYQLRVGQDLSEGLVTVEARVIDDAGNVATSSPLTIRIDTTFDDQPTLRLDPNSDNLRPGDNVTSRRRPVFIGTAEAGATVELVDEDGDVLASGQANLTSLPGQPAPPAGQRYYQVVLAQNLGNGPLSLRARARDVAGNPSPLTTPLAIRIVSVADDYDLDGQADAVVFRPAAPGQPGLWSIVESSGGGTRLQQIIPPGGSEYVPSPDDVPLRGDFDGDGRADLALWQPSTSTFVILQSTLGLKIQQFGWAPDVLPAVADYDGDGKTDVAIYSKSSGWIAAIRSTAGGIFYSLDVPNGVPIPADYDGDFKVDPAVFNPVTADWTILRSTTGAVATTQYGAGSQAGLSSPDVPVPADFNGDGTADFALFRPSTAQFIIRHVRPDGSFIPAAQGGVRIEQFGWAGVDIPTTSDYDGDGKADLSVYRPAGFAPAGVYLSRLSSGGIQRDPATGTFPRPFDPAAPGDLPVQAPFSYRLTGGQVLVLGTAQSSSTGGTRSRGIAGQPAVTAANVGGTVGASHDNGRSTRATPMAPVAIAPPVTSVSTHSLTAWERLMQFRKDRREGLLASWRARRS